MNRIPTLDGWRGIAILLVINSHLCGNGIVHPPAWWWHFSGPSGVNIFFVLSGYLITTKLLEGPMDLKRFYVRRFFRLMPAAWIYLGTVLLFGWLMHMTLAPTTDLRACLLFYRNFSGSPDGQALEHFWSLSLEEQFYLAWPCILLLAGARRSQWIAIAGALGCAAWRWTHWALYNNEILSVETQVRADALMVGCLLALLLSDTKFRSFAHRFAPVWVAPALIATAYAAWRSDWLIPLYENVAIAGLIAASVLHPRSILARPLDFPPLAWLGTISYSLYLWQQLFIREHSPIFLVAIAVPLFTLASYYCIERPSVRFGHWVTRKHIVYATAVC